MKNDKVIDGKRNIFVFHLWEDIINCIYDFETKNIKVNVTMIMHDISNRRNLKSNITYSYLSLVLDRCTQKKLIKKDKHGRESIVSLTPLGLSCAKSIITLRNAVSGDERFKK